MIKTIISPSILSADFLNLEQDLKCFETTDDLWFHLDIMDGHFVPNLTFGTPIVEKIQKITTIPLDAHFMVTNPELYIELFKNSKLHNFTFHWEVENHHHRLIHEIKKHYPSVGISLNPSTPVNIIPEFILESVDLILIMTVNPGFGGQTFIESCLEKIQTLNNLRNNKKYKYSIQVDGGVSNKNAKILIESGANNLVAGSYIFKHNQNEYKKAVNSLRDF